MATEKEPYRITDSYVTRKREQAKAEYQNAMQAAVTEYQEWQSLVSSPMKLLREFGKNANRPQS
jgi:hypothetical protein